MKIRLFLTFSVTLLLFSGCSGKQYFNPIETYSASHASKSYGGSVIDLSRDGATLKSGQYIGISGISSIEMDEGYRFLSENKKYILSSNAKGVLNIIDKNTQKSVRAISLHVPVVSATINKGIVAYILNNNTFGLYEIESNRKVAESRSGETYAIDTRAASPLFIDNLVVMPMLDGKVIIVDIYNTDNAKVVYLSSDKVFNNIIHLSRTRIDSTMVAATPKKIISIGSGGKNEYHANISEVLVADGSIFLFTKEGEVMKLNYALEVIIKKKFKFAHFAVATLLDDRIFALDQEGSLIVLSSDLKEYKIYDLGSLDSPAFITGSSLYKDGEIIDLSTLSYK